MSNERSQIEVGGHAVQIVRSAIKHPHLGVHPPHGRVRVAVPLRVADARRIWLNLELAKKPAPCLEYVLVHELVHLLERYHNERFLAIMDRQLPQWRQRRHELNSAPLCHDTWTY